MYLCLYLCLKTGCLYRRHLRFKPTEFRTSVLFSLHRNGGSITMFRLKPWIDAIAICEFCHRFNEGTEVEYPDEDICRHRSI